MSGIIKPSFGAQLNLDHPLAQGLVGCWLFNEGSGNRVHDYSGKGNHGTLINMADPPTSTSGYRAGPHGGALAFDGSNDYLTVDSMNGIPLLDTPRTISIWINHISFYGYCMGWGNASSSQAFEMNVTSNAVLIDRYGAGSTFTFPSINTGVWYHIVVTYINSSLTAYVNGYGLTNSFSLSDTQAGALNIGRRSSQGYYYTAAIIAHASVYNRALSAVEVAQLYAFPYCMFEESAYPAWMVAAAATAGGQATAKRFGGIPHMAINKGVW